ncbi:MAG TPA: hypothetical protein VFN23_05985 [Ktedonobacteraceae bacterium]|nr:hypothetical protein [Ktedonobacteraceae bacterium]
MHYIKQISANPARMAAIFTNRSRMRINAESSVNNPQAIHSMSQQVDVQ